jgi:dTDP-4-dehydrorhamnose reductase
MILLLGANGYVAESFINYFYKNEIDFEAVSRDDFDYTNFNNLYFFLKNNIAAIDTVINCAGYVGKPNVDACELAKSDCIKGNVLLPQMVSELCYQFSIKFVHISSGCIYNGYEKEFTEEDEPNFCFNSKVEGSFYSGTKAMAEDLIHKEASYVCRLRIPFDHIDNPRNYLSKIQTYQKLLNMENSISHRLDFVEACMHLVKRENNCPFGIYNITNTGKVDTKQICDLVSKHLNINNDFDFFESIEEFYNIGAIAPRSNCLLDNSKLLATGFKMRSTEEALEDSLKNWRT